MTIDVANMYNLYGFDGTKSIMFSTAGPLGGHNPQLGVVWLSCGFLWAIIALTYCSLGMKNGHFVKRTKEAKIEWLCSQLSWNKYKRSSLHEAIVIGEHTAPPDVFIRRESVVRLPESSMRTRSRSESHHAVELQARMVHDHSLCES